MRHEINFEIAREKKAMEKEKAKEELHAKMLKLWNDGLVDREISEVLKVPKQSVWKWRTGEELPSNRGIFCWGEREGNGE